MNTKILLILCYVMFSAFEANAVDKVEYKTGLYIVGEHYPIHYNFSEKGKKITLKLQKLLINSSVINIYFNDVKSKWSIVFYAKIDPLKKEDPVIFISNNELIHDVSREKIENGYKVIVNMKRDEFARFSAFSIKNWLEADEMKKNRKSKGGRCGVKIK